MVKLLDQIGQRTHAERLQPADFVIRGDACEHRNIGGCRTRSPTRSPTHSPTHRIAQQHAAQAKQPGVLLTHRLQAQRGPLGGMQAPAHARSGHPARQAGQTVCRQAKALGDGRHLQQIPQLGGGKTLAVGVEQPFQRHQQPVATALRQIGDLKRNVACIVGAVLAKHGADRGGKALDVGHHHHHLTRGQRRAVGAHARRLRQQVQQLVVQDFHLALRTVGGVEHDGPVAGIGHPRRQLGQRYQIADVGLQLRQQRVAGAVVKQVDARQVNRLAVWPAALVLFKPVQLAHEIPPLPAPGGQQRVGMAVHRRPRHLRQIALAAQGVARPGGAQQLTALQDVGPVVAAGVGDGQQHLGVAGQRSQRGQRLARQMGRTKQHHPPGQGRRWRLALGQRGQKIRMHLGPDRRPLGRA